MRRAPARRPARREDRRATCAVRAASALVFSSTLRRRDFGFGFFGALLSSRSSNASSSCSTRRLPRSDFCPKSSRRAWRAATSGARSEPDDLASLRAAIYSAGSSPAFALRDDHRVGADKVGGRGSEEFSTLRVNHICCGKSSKMISLTQIVRSSSRGLGRHVFCGIRQSIPSSK